MPVLKFHARAALVALAMLAASTLAARAETLYLKCKNDVFTIDLTKHMVGDFPAKISLLAIDWDASSPDGTLHYHIDRSKGTITGYGVAHFSNRDIPVHPFTNDTCTKVSAPATKF